MAAGGLVATATADAASAASAASVWGDRGGTAEGPPRNLLLLLLRQHSSPALQPSSPLVLQPSRGPPEGLHQVKHLIGSGVKGAGYQWHVRQEAPLLNGRWWFWWMKDFPRDHKGLSLHLSPHLSIHPHHTLSSLSSNQPPPGGAGPVGLGSRGESLPQPPAWSKRTIGVLLENAGGLCGPVYILTEAICSFCWSRGLPLRHQVNRKISPR